MFWISVGLIAYVYLGYPLLLLLLSRRRRRQSRPSPSPDHVRTVSVVIPAYNEASVIAAKVANACEIEYPAERLQVIVVSDGSLDGTAEIARRVGRGRITLLEQPVRRGKAEALNAARTVATGEILVFTDANVLFERDAVRRLTEPFEDPVVGCVVGRVLLTRAESGEPAGEGVYMRYERWLHSMESRLGTMIGIDGAMFAIRRQLFPPLPSSAIVEDLVAGLRCLEQGSEIRFEPRAVGYEEAATSVADEFRRKARMTSGGFQALVAFRHLLDPLRYPLVSWQLVSHKLLRWLLPVPLLVTLTASLLLVPSPFYTAAFAAQALFYIFAAVGWRSVAARRRMLFYIPYYFCAVNLAALVGLRRFLGRSQSVLWEKAAR
jgi:cellulose synthase/poly-beta-1,6-N-acetylglucosamine synthase-like glycosyltransferase